MGGNKKSGHAPSWLFARRERAIFTFFSLEDFILPPDLAMLVPSVLIGDVGRIRHDAPIVFSIFKRGIRSEQ